MRNKEVFDLFRIFIIPFLMAQQDLTCSSLWDPLMKRTSVTCKQTNQRKSGKRCSSAHKTPLYRDDTATPWEAPMAFFVGIIQDEVAAKPCLFGIFCFWNKP